MDEVLLAKLEQTERVTLPISVVRAPEAAEFDSGANGYWVSATKSGGIPDSCDD